MTDQVEVQNKKEIETIRETRETKETRETREIKQSRIYDRSTLRVIILACLSISIAVFFMGYASYTITEQAVIDKLKKQDLGFIVQSISAKVDGRIVRAKETSLMMAEDPLLLQWVSQKDSDQMMRTLGQEKLKGIAENYDIIILLS